MASPTSRPSKKPTKWAQRTSQKTLLKRDTDRVRLGMLVSRSKPRRQILVVLTTEQGCLALLQIFLKHLFGREGDRGALVLPLEVLVMDQPLANDSNVEVRIRQLPDLPGLQKR